MSKKYSGTFESDELCFVMKSALKKVILDTCTFEQTYLEPKFRGSFSLTTEFQINLIAKTKSIINKHTSRLTRSFVQKRVSLTFTNALKMYLRHKTYKK